MRTILTSSFLQVLCIEDCQTVLSYSSQLCPDNKLAVELRIEESDWHHIPVVSLQLSFGTPTVFRPVAVIHHWEAIKCTIIGHIRCIRIYFCHPEVFLATKYSY